MAYMNTLNRLMDAAQKQCEPQTLEALKVRLGVSRQSMYDWRNGNKAISDEHLARLIELAGGDPADAIAVRREGAKSDHERAMWRSLARRLGAAAVLAVVALLPQGNAQANTRANLNDSQGYALCEMARRARALARRMQMALSRLTERAYGPSPVLA